MGHCRAAQAGDPGYGTTSWKEMVQSREKQGHLFQVRVCPDSEKKDGQSWGVDIVSGFKSDEAQLVSIPMKVNMENGSPRDVVDS